MNKSLISAMGMMMFLLFGCKEYKPVPVPPPDAKLNPSPKEIYEITITMEEAPESLRGFPGRVQYSIKNYLECVPLDHTMAIGGTRPNFNRKREIEFTRQKDNIFVARLDYDIFLDEDYYGLGTCHWRVAGVDAILDMPSNDYGRLDIKDPKVLDANPIEKKYCLKAAYPGTEVQQVCTSLEGLARMAKPREWFFEVTTLVRRK